MSKADIEQTIKKQFTDLQDADILKLSESGSLVIDATQELEDKVKMPLNILKAQMTNIETLKNYQASLFSGEYELVTGQDRETLKNNFNLIIRDFKGLTLDYWEDKVLTACYCLLNRQNSNKLNPHIIIETKAELYQEVLEKNKGGRYGGKEREKFDKALKSLQATIHHFVYRKAVKDGKKLKTEFVTIEAPLITSVVCNYVSENDNENTAQDIKEKGRYFISFHPIVLDQIIEHFRFLPRNISKEIKALCSEVKQTTPLMEGFIRWLHAHSMKSTEVRRTREALIRELKLDKQYKTQKGRTIKALHQAYEIAKRTGYLKDYAIDQKGKECIVDVFYLNPNKYEHLQTKKKNEAPLLPISKKKGRK